MGALPKPRLRGGSTVFRHVLFCACSLLLVACATSGATRLWTGASGGFWTDPGNWGGAAPAPGDALVFGGANRLDNTNDFPGTNWFSGIDFPPGAGPFLLQGNPVYLSGGITNRSTLAQTNALTIVAGDLTLSVTSSNAVLAMRGAIYSTGTVTKAGPGTAILTGANSAPGGTSIQRGAVKLVNADRLGAPGAPLVLNGGTLKLANYATLNNRVVNLGAGGGTLDVEQLSVLTLTNPVSGPGALIKSGLGTVVFKNVVGSTGPVAVQAGSVQVDGTMSGPTNVTVSNGGSLCGGGSVHGNVTLADGTIAPGANTARPGTLTVSNLFLGLNSVIRLDLNKPNEEGGTNDLLIVRGNLTLRGILKVTGSGQPGVYPIIRYAGQLTDLGLQLGPAVDGTLIIDTTNKLISLQAAAFPASPPMPMRSLFIGNSLTMATDVPGTVAALAAANGDWFSYTTELSPGTTLEWHRTNNLAMPLVDSGNFDLILLQEYSYRPTFPPERDNLMYPAVRDFFARATARNQRLMLFETWSYPGGDTAHCGSYDTPLLYRGCSRESMGIALRMGYGRIANELGVAISPVGLAWARVQADGSGTQLYSGLPGDYHQGPSGGYLAACVHYASIFGRSPVGNPAMGSVADPAVAANLQEAAEHTVFDDPWALDPFGFASNRFYWATSWSTFTNRIYSPLSGVIISGNGGLPSPSVLLDVPAGITNNLYIGVFGHNYETTGQGRLYVRQNGSLVVTGEVVVGKEGKGWIQQRGGTLRVPGNLTLAQEPLSLGTYALEAGELIVGKLAAGEGEPRFTFSGGRLSFSSFGSTNRHLDLIQDGGTLAVSNEVSLFGNLSMSNTATMDVRIGPAPSRLIISGGATLSGTLVVSFPADWTPAVNQSWTLATAGQVSGRFNRILLPKPLPANLKLAVTCQPAAIVATVMNLTSDSDSDGLPDWYEAQYFGLTNSGQDWAGSFLNDGIPNGVKYAFLMDPTVPVVAESKMPLPLTTNSYPALSFRQLSGGQGTVGVNYTANGVIYTVQSRNFLTGSSWLQGTNAVVWLGDRIDNGDGSETVTVRSKNPISAGGCQLLQLKVSRSN